MSNINGLGLRSRMPGEWVERPDSPALNEKNPDTLDVQPEVLATTPTTGHTPTFERRSAPRPEEAFSALLFSNSAFNGNIPCVGGTHPLEGMGLENALWGMGRLQLDVPQDTQLQVHSHAIDREPVAPLPPPSSMGAMVTGFVTFWALSAWSWISSAIKREPELDTALEKIAPCTLAPRDGKLRIHGIEAALTQPLTITRPGLPPWLMQARITGASVDEHGRVTPRGEVSFLGLFSVSLARFRDSMPTLNVEIEKLRHGELVANTDAKGPDVNVDAICQKVSEITGEGVFTVTRQSGAPPLQYKLDVMEPLRNLLSGVDYDVTPVKSEMNARVKLKPNAKFDLEAHQRATTHLQLRVPNVDQRTLRVESDSRVVMPHDGANWWRAHTVFVVDHSPTHATDDAAWEPMVSGNVTLKQRDEKVRANLKYRTAPGIAGPFPKSGSGTAVWTAREDASFKFEKAAAHVPLDDRWGRFNVDIERGDMRIKAARTKQGQGKHLHVSATSRVVEVNRKKA